MGEEASNSQHIMAEGQPEYTGQECIFSENCDKVTNFQCDILKQFTVRNVKESI